MKLSKFVKHAVCITILFVIYLCIGTDNIFRWTQAGFTIREQERRIRELEEANAELDRRIEVLTADRDTLEKYARENFFFCKPDDDVYIVE